MTLKKTRWVGYKELKNLNAPAREELAEKFKFISYTNLEFAAFVSLLYLSGCRIGELINYKYRGMYAKELEEKGYNIEFPGLRVKDIHFEKLDYDGKKMFLILNLRVEKQDKVEKKIHEIKEIDREKFLQRVKETIGHTVTCEIFIREGTPEAQMLSIVEQYLDTFFYDPILKRYKKEEVLFNYSKVNYHNRIKTHFGKDHSAHIFRVWRAKHLITYWRFNIHELKRAIRWKDWKMPFTYVETSTVELRRKYLETDRDRIEDF